MQGQLKKKVFVASAHPSQVLYETEYEYGLDQKLMKTATYSFRKEKRIAGKH